MFKRFKFLVVLFMCAQGLAAQELTYRLDPAKTKIQFSVPATMHTVHGSFQLKSGSIHFNPATDEAGGLVVVDVKSGDTGNDGRDRKMHREVLQSDRYPEATFKPTRIRGAANLAQSSTVEVEGVLTLRGTEHPISLSIHVQQSGGEFDTRMSLIIPYIAWGLKNPSTFLLHVSDKVDLDITSSGRIMQGGAPSAAP